MIALPCSVIFSTSPSLNSNFTSATSGLSIDAILIKSPLLLSFLYTVTTPFSQQFPKCKIACPVPCKVVLIEASSESPEEPNHILCEFQKLLHLPKSSPHDHGPLLIFSNVQPSTFFAFSALSLLTWQFSAQTVIKLINFYTAIPYCLFLWMKTFNMIPKYKTQVLRLWVKKGQRNFITFAYNNIMIPWAICYGIINFPSSNHTIFW